MELKDLTVNVVGTYTPQTVYAKYVRSMVIAPPNVHYLDPEILEIVDASDPDDLLIIPLRCKDRLGRPVGVITISEPSEG